MKNNKANKAAKKKLQKRTKTTINNQLNKGLG